MPLAITPDLVAKLASLRQVGAGKPQGEIEIDYVIPGFTELGELQDLNAAYGTVSRDVTRHTGVDIVQTHWVNVDKLNDGNDSTYATLETGSDGAWTEYVTSDLGAAYAVSAFVVKFSNDSGRVTEFQYSLDGVTWVTLTGVETGSRMTIGGATFTFTAPITARYWAFKAEATGFHPTCQFNTWRISGTPVVVHADTHATATYQVASIGIDRSRKTAATQLDVVIGNEDGSKGWYSGDGRVFIPNNPIRAYIWLGARANRVLRYTGLTEQFSEHRDPKTLSIKALSRTRILLAPHQFFATAPQDAATTGAVRTEANGVFLGKSPEYIAGAVLDAAGWPSADRNIAVSGITIPEYDLSDGSPWLDQIVGTDRLSTIAGWDYREDAAGVIHLGPNKLQAAVEPDPDWTFRPGLNVMAFDHQADDEARVTRVRLSGPMTTSTPIWKSEWATSVLRHPVGMAYRPSESGFIYAIDANSQYLSKIDQATRKVVARWYLGGSLTYRPVGLTTDPVDTAHFYVLDGDWPLGGTTHAKIHKFAWSTKAHVSSSALPDGEWSALKTDGTSMWLTNYGTDRLYKKTYSAGGTATAVANYSYSGKANPTGLYIDGTTIGIHFAALEAFYLVDTSAPGTITGSQSTKGTHIFGGEKDLTTHADLYVDYYSSSAGSVEKYALSEDVQVDVVKWATDQALEDALGFQAGFPDRVHDLHPGDAAHPWDERTATISLRTVNSEDQAQAVADAELVLRRRIRRVLDLATTGHPGIEIDDAIAYPDPVAGTDAMWMIDTAREQLAETYTQTMSVLPWEAPA